MPFLFSYFWCKRNAEDELGKTGTPSSVSHHLSALRKFSHSLGWLESAPAPPHPTPASFLSSKSSQDKGWSQKVFKQGACGHQNTLATRAMFVKLTSGSVEKTAMVGLGFGYTPGSNGDRVLCGTKSVSSQRWKRASGRSTWIICKKAHRMDG